jgi:chorismate-pyruvate lyase
MSSALQPRIEITGWTALLERFYARGGFTLPPLERLKDDEVPHPYKALLVHSQDMTPTLESFYQQPVGLTVLSRERHHNSYYREVILTVENGVKPIVYGAIRIRLDHLPAPVCQRVLEEHRPFGNILQSEALPHISWPQAFFRVQSDTHTHSVLRLPRACALYGRRNVLLDGARRLLAEVIEILAPVSKADLNHE